MSLFKPWSNTAARLSLAFLAMGGVGTIGGLMLWVRSPLYTEVGNAVDQPVQFDHRHHVGEEGIDCRYCHSQVEKAASAGIPPTQLCLNCHAQIWNKSPKLAAVRESFFTGKSIEWEKVHKLPHYVYFNHSIHVAKGVGCATCHGRVDQMPAIAKVNTLQMRWCLDCHRNPEKFLRPTSEVVNLKYEVPSSKDEVVKELLTRGLAKGDAEAQALASANSDPKIAFGLALKSANHVQTRVSCDTCHR
jgi:hypothetical protein